MTGKMVVSTAVIASMVAHGIPTSNVVVCDSVTRLLNPNRFSNVDLSNKARSKVKCGYANKQRKRKNKRKQAKALKEQGE